MCREKLVARKCKFAMKIVKNCIKNCMYCGDYQSIMSDVDKHQRSCASNPDRDNTLAMDDNFNEAHFFREYGNATAAPESSKELPSISLEARNPDTMLPPIRGAPVPKLPEETKKVEKLDLGKMVSGDDEFEMEERKSQGEEPQESAFDNSDDSGEHEVPLKPLPSQKEIEELMILPHLHKHDLHRKKIYEKPSTWI